MSGFVGFTNTDLSVDKNKTINEMMNTIIHRGPDGSGIHIDEHVALGFCHLMTTELAENAPNLSIMQTEKHILVFDGLVYNHQQLKAELLEKGYKFKTNSESELIIHGYEEYGVNLLQMIRGAFAFTIWDKSSETLFLARDLFGIKPLYYTQNTSDNTFIFGSEIKSFLKHPSFKKELNNEALMPFLTFQYSALDETFFKGVYKLKPGHYMIYKKGQTEITPYTSINFEEKKASIEEYTRLIKETIKESVKCHKVSDVEVGSFLSGGIDSSYITALSKPKCTFSVGFKDYEGIFNETNLAKELSDILEIENHRVLISADECFDKLPTIQYHMDEPQANLSSIPLFFLSQLASKNVKVVMSGEGADELFGGYAWYQLSPIMNKYRKLPFFIRRSLYLLFKKSSKNRVGDFIVRGGQKVEEVFVGQAKIFEEDEAANILKKEYTQGPTVSEITKKVFEKVKDKDDLTKKQFLDLHLWLPGDILLKADKMTMAHSLEVRVPFLDKEVMSLASKLPSNMKVTDSETKYALRLASKDVLPSEWSNRPKVGFPVPMKNWLREEKYYNIVKEMFQKPFAEEFFNTKKLLNYLDDHYEGKNIYTRQIWTVYVFLIWYQKYFVEMS